MKVRNHPRISIDPTVCHGKPVVTGTRVLVSNVLGSLAAGQTGQEILQDYPGIAEQDVSACLEFASVLAQFESVLDSIPSK